MKQYRNIFLILLVIGLQIPATVQALNKQSRLYSVQEAESIGMTRSWFTQVNLNIGKEKIVHVTIVDNVLFVVTDGGTIQTINADTGTTIWQRRFGLGYLFTTAASANSKVVGIINGTTLYLFDRFNGKLLLEKALNGNPSGGPQLSERYVFVPMVSERMLALPIEQDVRLANDLDTIYELQKIRQSLNLSDEVKQQIINEENQVTPVQYRLRSIEDRDINSCPLLGLSFQQPYLTTQSVDNDYVCWTTNNGWLLIGRMAYKNLILDRNALELVYRISVAPQLMYVNAKRIGSREVEEPNNIAARPLFVPKDECTRFILAGDKKENSNESDEKQSNQPSKTNLVPEGGMILCGSNMGYVYAVNDVSGDLCWQFQTGSAIEDSIISDGEFCYIPSAKGFLFSVSLKYGTEKWVAPEIKKPVAVSKNRLYVIDRMGNLVILNKTNGKRIQSLSLDGETEVIYNSETDRLFFVSEDGLVQCMHEIQQEKPIRYRPTRSEYAKQLSLEMTERWGRSLLDPPTAPNSPALTPTKVQTASPNASAETTEEAAPLPTVPSAEDAETISEIADPFGDSESNETENEVDFDNNDLDEDNPFGDNIFENL
ncbi:MAG: PQQ-binding-like beta-propeller repeat protein [Planctomycetia bacterium]|nr:PQQ-binding-like beta-propeller repeat protein [Planctomycetia bacterium]